MYYFENDEPDSCIGFLFTESCTITVPQAGGRDNTSFDHLEYSVSGDGEGIVFKEFSNEVYYPFVITTIGGKLLYA